jgi:hypothetical protein
VDAPVDLHSPAAGLFDDDDVGDAADDEQIAGERAGQGEHRARPRTVRRRQQQHHCGNVRRILGISREPAAEALVIVAHGPNEEDDNRRWLTDMKSLAARLTQTEHFASMEYLTLRDAPRNRYVMPRRRSCGTSCSASSPQAGGF